MVLHKKESPFFSQSNLQPGAPLGSRWNAFKNAFKAGKIAQCPELKLAKEFEAYEQVKTLDHMRTSKSL